MATSIRRMESIRRLQQIKKESSGPVNFGRNMIACCTGGGMLGLFCCVLLIGLAGFALSIAKISIGSIYVDSCPAEPLVAIYLIVGGVMSLLVNCTCRPSKSDDGQLKVASQGCSAVIGLLVCLFSLAWLIVGTVFTVRTSNAVSSCQATQRTTTSSPVTSTSPFSPDSNITSTPSPGSNPCPECSEQLLMFATGILITEWCFFGILLLVFTCCCCVPYCVGHYCLTEEE